MLHRFAKDVEGVALPEKFTWPFHYVPHTLSRLAADEVIEYISHSRVEWHQELAHGKMFGVMVVECEDGSIGYIAAFSGNIAGVNHHDFFVPPVYDMLKPNDFFRRGEAEITAINQRIRDLENGEEYHAAKEALSQLRATLDAERSALMEQCAERKAEREKRRECGEYDEAELVLESQRDNALKQRMKRAHKTLLEDAERRVELLSSEIVALRKLRQERSAALQMALFREFRMLNGTSWNCLRLRHSLSLRLALVSAVPLNCCNMPISTTSNLRPWLSFGGVSHRVVRCADMARSTRRAMASANPYWSICLWVLMLSLIRLWL